MVSVGTLCPRSDDASSYLSGENGSILHTSRHPGCSASAITIKHAKLGTMSKINFQVTILRRLLFLGTLKELRFSFGRSVQHRSLNKIHVHLPFPVTEPSHNSAKRKQYISNKHTKSYLYRDVTWATLRGTSGNMSDHKLGTWTMRTAESPCKFHNTLHRAFQPLTNNKIYKSLEVEHVSRAVLTCYYEATGAFSAASGVGTFSRKSRNLQC